MSSVKDLLQAILEKKDYTEVFNSVIAEKVQSFLAQKRAEIAASMFVEAKTEASPFDVNIASNVPSQAREQYVSNYRAHKSEQVKAQDSGDKELSNLHNKALWHLRKLSTELNRDSKDRNVQHMKQIMQDYNNSLSDIKNHESKKAVNESSDEQDQEEIASRLNMMKKRIQHHDAQLKRELAAKNQPMVRFHSKALRLLNKLDHPSSRKWNERWNQYQTHLNQN